MKIILLKGSKKEQRFENPLVNLEKSINDLEKPLKDFEKSIEQETHGKSGVVVLTGSNKVVKLFRTKHKG